MGSHCGPTFSIIFMDAVEKKALSKLPTRLQPAIYKRYIDDTLIGPIKDQTEADEILQVFNITESCIRFTMETPNDEGWLPFLNIKLKRDQQEEKLIIANYQKETHSGIYLHKKSHHPYSIKMNYIRNLFSQLNSQASTETRKNLQPTN